LLSDNHTANTTDATGYGQSGEHVRKKLSLSGLLRNLLTIPAEKGLVSCPNAHRLLVSAEIAMFAKERNSRRSEEYGNAIGQNGFGFSLEKGLGIERDRSRRCQQSNSCGQLAIGCCSDDCSRVVSFSSNLDDLRSGNPEAHEALDDAKESLKTRAPFADAWLTINTQCFLEQCNTFHDHVDHVDCHVKHRS
jgi:hypothetical protein